MVFWDSVVDFLRLFILTQAQFCGGNLGGGILLGSLILRASLYPLSLKIARASAAHQKAMEKIKPELDAVQEKFKSQPDKKIEETQKVFKRHGVAPMPVASCLGTLAQLPVFIAFYSAVRQVADIGGRFLWIGNIAKPDIVLTAVVSMLTLGSAMYSTTAPATPEARRMMLILPIVVTILILAKTSAGVAIYWGVSSAVSLMQSFALRRSLTA